MAKYVHTPITTDRSIRILTLHPGAPDDRLRGDLEIVNIDASGGDYETISYVWGNSSKTHHMVCNGSEIPITESLHGALTCVRLPHMSRRLWADQICIDQDNVKEKSSQVPLMDVIYRNAGRVLVWLGHDQDGVAGAAFSLITNLAATFADEKKRFDFDQVHSDSLLWGSRPKTEDEWSPLRALSGLPWFTRVWVIQEIGTKAPATLFWGDARVEWDFLCSVCQALTDYHHLRMHVDIQTPKIKYMYRRFIEPDRTSRHANRFSFIYELHRARHLQASDPRDRVYALLGHYAIRNSSNEELRALKPDYNKALEEVYIDVATRNLVGNSTLLTLASVEHNVLPSKQVATKISSMDYSSISPNKLPSWVPDWRVYQTYMLSEPTSPHRASGALPASLRVDSLSKTVCLKGVLVDAVVACSQPLGPREFHVDSYEGFTSIEQIWREVCGQSDFDVAARYLTLCGHSSPGEGESGHDRDEQEIEEGSAVFAYLQTLSNACVAVAWQDGQPYDSVPARKWLAHGAKYLSHVVQSCGVSRKLQGLAEGGDMAKWARAANNATRNRAFARTRYGYYVLGPKMMEPGDLVCVLYGGKMPFCPQPWGSKYLLVGECYVHGIMNGEMIKMAERGGIKEEVFQIV
ncbi:het domain-containing protein [Colletotrichum kahawae]|uniref:Het domain-containing protein n=1 Tax=Colletotrichum kahawae TaxID=34407 RepID=A0AAD9XX86_COLKA|nr:het domain-containing protein [Colletotrichum kahawae]